MAAKRPELHVDTDRLRVAVLCLGLVFLATAGRAESIPGTTTPVASLAADLEWDFSIAKKDAPKESQDPRDVELQSWQFQSKEPYSRTDRGPVYLRLSLSVYRFGEEGAADDQIAEWREQGRRPTGLTYAWVQVVQRDSYLYRLDIPCLFSKANVEKITASLARAVAAGKNEEHVSVEVLFCPCGSSCQVKAR